jgi:purine-binding chemotaxis protein CheW
VKTEPDWLLCRIGERLLAVPLAAVLETMRPMPVASITGAPPFVLGVSTIRGEVLPVIDTAALLGAGDCPVTRFVTITTGARALALAVGSVLGIRRLTDGDLRELPPLLHSIDRVMLSAIGILDEGLLLALDHSHLVPETLWATLSEQVTTS